MEEVEKAKQEGIEQNKKEMVINMKNSGLSIEKIS